MTLQTPEQRVSPRRSRVRAAFLGAVTLLAAALMPSSMPPPSPPANAANQGRPIDTSSQAGVRAQQTLDMLNSDWPIGPVGVHTLAASNQVETIVSTMEHLWWDRPFGLDSVDLRMNSATLHLSTSYGAHQDIRLHLDDEGRVDTFDVDTSPPAIHSWADLDATLNRSGSRYSYQAAKIVDGHCERVAGANTAVPLPTASIFKLYVLHALATAITAGTVSWDDQLTVTAKSKAVGSSGLDVPVGSHVSVRTAAQQMIAASDNMATDLLIGKLGPAAIDRALATAGHHDPASMTPFPTMYELFSIGWGKPDLREQWRQGSPEQRARLLEQADSASYEPDPARAHTPASSFGVEWYANAEDICRVHTTLQADAVGAAAPVSAILSAVPGIALDRELWPYIGAKAGGLPGDLTFSWYAVDRNRQPWVLSFQLNWLRDHGPYVTRWMLAVARQTFDLIGPK